MKIKKLSIKNLWGKYTFSINFDKRVTILIGKNGSGKSTILNLLDDLLSTNGKKNDYKFEKVTLDLDKNKTRSIEQRNIDITKEIEELDEVTEKKVKDLLSRIQKDLISKMHERKDAEFMEKESLLKLDDKSIEKINYLFLSTFDMEAKNKELVHKHYEKSYIKTELDIFLNDLITKFKLYQLKLKEKVEKAQKQFDLEIEEYSSTKELKELKEKLLEKREIIDQIYKDRDFFKNKINELFSDTGKTIKLDENNSIIFNIDEEESLTPYQLSSGEKQILIIMLNVMLLENKPTILLMDEPEVSLHVEWQRIFIQTILELNENLQLVITTHSPALVSKGYRNNVVSLDNFTVKH